MAEFQFRKAARKAVPMLVSIAGVSGSGKTYGALLMAAGLAGPNGRVGFIDTENGRGEMYTDSPGISKAFPNGYEYTRLDPPFTPQRYIAALQAAEAAGFKVVVIDSGSHEWEGIGGCTEIAENNPLKDGMPNWAKAKMAHKRFMNHLLCTNMHIITCLRARDKVKMVKVEKNGKKTTEVVPIGVQPIAEKSFVFEMTVSLRVEEESHLSVPVKVPEPLVHLFPSGHLITKADGERMREHNEAAPAPDAADQLRKRSRAAAEDGMDAYKAFFASLTAAQKQIVQPIHEENKSIASDVDRAAKEGQPGLLDQEPAV